jgi:hypothetical protein
MPSANELTIHILAAVIRSRRVAAIFMASQDRVPTNTRPSARIRNIIIGIPVLSVESSPRLSDAESVGASVKTAMGSCALIVLTAGGLSGHATGAAGTGGAAWALVSDRGLGCGAGNPGIDDAVLSAIALLTGAVFGLTACIST